MDSHPRVFPPDALDKHELILMGTGWLCLGKSALRFQSKTICFDTGKREFSQTLWHD